MQTEEEKILLPHHEQQSLCTTRLPYRQGRKLTAVKVYTVTKESNHLLIFGVPSLNLRQELKSNFIKFGKLLQFYISNQYTSEQFTETYHAVFEKIQSARIAKRMLDTKNFYGGVLHVCYAPELETVAELREKLLQRQKDVLYRLRNLQKDDQNSVLSDIKVPEVPVTKETNIQSKPKLNMGEVNTLIIGKGNHKRKKKDNQKLNEVMPNEIGPQINEFKVLNEHSDIKSITPVYKATSFNPNTNSLQDKFKRKGNKLVKRLKSNQDDVRDTEDDVDVVDCTKVNEEVVTNINEHLNYNKFGNEVIRVIPPKPVNKICFNISKT